jgi:PAS domain-containing protein
MRCSELLSFLSSEGFEIVPTEERRRELFDSSIDILWRGVRCGYIRGDTYTVPEAFEDGECEMMTYSFDDFGKRPKDLDLELMRDCQHREQISMKRKRQRDVQKYFDTRREAARKEQEVYDWISSKAVWIGDQ